MKKSISLIAMALGSVICFNSCNDKESLAPSHGNEGIPFEIAAGFSDTKTVNDGMETKWASGDAINLFHAQAGTSTYVNDKQFTLDDTRDGVFTGTLTGELTEGAYDWYAIYPYNSNITKPDGTDKAYLLIGKRNGPDSGDVQKGNDSMEHLSGRSCPLYGVAKNVPSSDRPGLVMEHLTSVVAVNVTNTAEEDLTVSSVSFTAPEGTTIFGSFYVDITGSDGPEYTNHTTANFTSNTSQITVEGGTPLKKGESAKFYLAVKPFTAQSGDVLKLSVNGYEKSITLTKDITFTAGKIKTLNFNFDKVVIDYVTLPWSEDFSGDMSLYTLVSGDSETKTYQENRAGGEKPELLVAKNNGSISVKIKAAVGKYDLSFKSNKPTSLNVSCDNANVQISKVEDILYSVLIAEGVDFFTLTIKNTTSDNARLDDILMTLAMTSIKADDEVKVSARAESAGGLNYTVLNPTTATMVATCDGTVVTDVDAEDGTCLYATSDNVSASPREGWIKLTYGSVEKIIKVTQAAPVFTLSSSEVVLGAEDNATATITVTSDFDWVSDISYGSDESLFVIEPSVCNWADDDEWKAASGETKVSVVAVANTSTSERTLGTITFTDAKTAATQTVIIKQRGAGSGPTVTNFEIVFSTNIADNNTELKSKDNISSFVSEGSEYIKSFTCNKAFGKSKEGIKLGSSKAKGTITLNLEDVVSSGIVSIQVVSAKYSSDDGTISLSADGCVLNFV